MGESDAICARVDVNSTMFDLQVIILGYNAVVLVAFGLFGLLLFPLQMLRKTGFKANLDNRQLMIYRVCGLWVAAAGVVSAVACTATLDSSQKKQACGFFAVVHLIEVA